MGYKLNIKYRKYEDFVYNIHTNKIQNLEIDQPMEKYFGTEQAFWATFNNIILEYSKLPGEAFVNIYNDGVFQNLFSDRASMRALDLGCCHLRKMDQILNEQYLSDSSIISWKDLIKVLNPHHKKLAY